MKPMTESSALFSRTFLVASACVKWALRLLVLGWLVLGLVWCILHFVIVPRIDDLRPWLEQEASQALGVGVRIGSMQATSNGLIPSLELKAVRLLDAQNNTLVELPLVVTAVSPRSLLAGGFDDLAHIRRTAHMAHGARQQALLGPATVAVHDDGDVLEGLTHAA
jgi:hypothetical protein